MISVLFVDDESKILDALKRTLRPLRNEWSPAFATGGLAALAMLEQDHFDVLVTDMRMPAMDGLALLEIVAARYPGLVRIILSGQSDVATIVKAAGIAHQYLSKPCPLDVLTTTVNRAIASRQMLGSAAIVELLSKLNNIPSAPPLYLEFSRLLEEPRTSIDEIGRLIARDMGMCAKVLQLANSPLFGCRYSVSDPSEAAGILGFNMLKNLALAVHVFRKFDPGKLKGLSTEGLWQHSFRTSLYAGAIASSISPEDRSASEHAQVAGLLHDVGHLLLACNLPDEYEQIAAMADRKDMDPVQAEQEILGTSHAEVGAYILSLWGLPQTVTEAILQHHTLQAGPARPSKVSVAVHAGDVLAFEEDGKTPFPDRPLIDQQLLATLGLGCELEGWRELCRRIRD